MATLNQKIIEHRRKAGAISYGGVAVTDVAVETRSANLDNRIVEGYAVIWGQRNLHGEKFVKGCFAKSIREHGPESGSKYQIKFLYNHNTDEPLSLFDEIREDEQGLYFRTKPLDDVSMADRTLKQLRSGTLNNYSQGFNHIWEPGKVEWDDDDNSLIVKEGILYEISVATIPSGLTTYTVRTAEAIDDLMDETEDFIKTLPRKQQLQARQLFTRHKSLIGESEPLEQKAKALGNSEPVERRGIDYKFLTQNFSL